MKRRVDPVTGFAYIEVLVAVLLLALCALPAANAIQNGLAAASAAPTRAMALRCMRDKMEAVLAEPYDTLLAAAQSNNQPVAAYSEASKTKSGGCVARTVYIGIYKQDSIGLTASETALLRVDVVSPETTYAFTTLVAP